MRRRRRAASAAALLPVPLWAIAIAIAGCGGPAETTGGSAGGGSTATGGAAEEQPGGQAVSLTKIGDFDTPVYVTAPSLGPDSNDPFVVEQGGRIQRLAHDGSTSTFLDLSGAITSGGEQGLLSLAFPPDDWHHLYVDYTDTDGNTRVVEYGMDADGTAADPSTARDVLEVDQPYPNHNGGQLQFDSAGLLYIGLGDGGSEGDPDRTAQDLSSPLGKILRIDPQATGGKPYSIPPDNPFAGPGAPAGAMPEIFAYGLRNPWRFSFDPNTGDLWIGDVGQNELEEVDGVTPQEAVGANFGWSAFEGNKRLNTDQHAPGAVPPVLTYPHDGGACSITGGYVVRDIRLPGLDGRYLYGDFCTGQLRSFTAKPGVPAAGDSALGPTVPSLSSFGIDPSGRVYVASLDGPVYRIDPR